MKVYELLDETQRDLMFMTPIRGRMLCHSCESSNTTFKGHYYTCFYMQDIEKAKATNFLEKSILQDVQFRYYLQGVNDKLKRAGNVVFDNFFVQKRYWLTALLWYVLLIIAIFMEVLN